MAGYTAISEVGNSLVELLRREMTPEPVSKPELIGLCSPYEPEDFQLTVFLFHCEQENQAQPVLSRSPAMCSAKRLCACGSTF